MFIKDSVGVVINTDDSEYNTILTNRRTEKIKQEAYDCASRLQHEVDAVHKELEEIRAMISDFSRHGSD